jgi:arsenate reductase
MKNILILCTGNSCRSIMAEAILNRKGQGRFVAFSAGSKPAGRVNPHAMSLLERKRYSTQNLRSKSWDEFSGATAPALDYVITVCGNAAGEACPVWIGAPVSAHWGIADPADVTGPGEVIAAAFETAYRLLEARIDKFLSLDHDGLTRIELTAALREIGKMEGAA